MAKTSSIVQGEWPSSPGGRRFGRRSKNCQGPTSRGWKFQSNGLQLAKIYEEDCKEVAKSRNLFDRICNQWVYEFKNVDDLAECYVAWVELELRQETWDDALDIIRTSVIIPPFAPKWIRGLPKSLRLWDLLLDLEESLGTAQTTKDAYSRAIEQKVATPLHILNFATFFDGAKILWGIF